MKKWYLGVLVASLLILLILTFGVITSPLAQYTYTTSLQTPFFCNTTNPLESIRSSTAPSLTVPFFYNTTNPPLESTRSSAPPTVQNPENGSNVVSSNSKIVSLFAQRNISDGEQQALQTWNHLKQLIGNAPILPNGLEAIKEAGLAWNGLLASVEKDRLTHGNETSDRRGKEKQCPHFIRKMNATGPDNSGFKLQVPCGLTLGSSITIIAIPGGLLGNFQIDLTGEPLPGEPDPPIILHYNVRLHGDDMVTEDPVIVQSTWSTAQDWGEEEHCPTPDPEENKKVDGLEPCNRMVGKDNNGVLASDIHRNSKGSRKFLVGSEASKAKTYYFPFKQGYPSVATLGVGTEGIQMTVDGKHTTSFAFRQSLEPWFVSEVRISGDIKLISVMASGLPSSDYKEHIIDLESLVLSPPLAHRSRLDLFIGVFSKANNFKRRMAVRRTWMQYAAVRSGAVAVRFFVGLHKNQMVNEELWNEVQTYHDIQLMPFVDYYSLITWKTVAICIFGTEAVSAKFVMKTDDDAFVRVDEVLASLRRINVTHGLLYGLVNSVSNPHRNVDSKWFISQKEWAEESYPPWAHGPGYVVSRDIAKEVYRRHKKGRLKMFKLEDVAMGIWIAQMKKGGMKVRYENDKRIFNTGCEDGYVVAHYQGPREMLCLWQKLQHGNNRARCCVKPKAKATHYVQKASQETVKMVTLDARPDGLLSRAS